MSDDLPKAFVFFGTRDYGVHVAVARTLEAACKLVGIEPEKCRPWNTPRKTPWCYEYKVLEDGDVEDFGE